MPEHNPAENCYCGGPEEIYPHQRGTRSGCRTKTDPSDPLTRETPDGELSVDELMQILAAGMAGEVEKINAEAVAGD